MNVLDTVSSDRLLRPVACLPKPSSVSVVPTPALQYGGLERLMFKRKPNMSFSYVRPPEEGSYSIAEQSLFTDVLRGSHQKSNQKLKLSKEVQLGPDKPS